MGTKSDRLIICFYLGKPCRYGMDAAPEEQMECSQCPAYIMWSKFMEENRKKISGGVLISEETGLDSDNRED